ncbi:hypothetical protein [Flexithrix dorotheae]|uniref:hypothetical protein n=1 Tax=Flexithrix dorotheae TaxID=70993 RepID=UPI0012FB1C21|nr:hypothetical protein [Flexithrix dorotheae]
MMKHLLKKHKTIILLGSIILLFSQFSNAQLLSNNHLRLYSSDINSPMDIKGEINVGSLNPGISTVGAQITNRYKGHLLFDIRANDASDAFAIRTDSDFNGVVDKISFLVRPSGRIGIGTITPISLLELKQSNAEGLSFSRDSHDTYELFVGGTKGLYIRNRTDGNRVEMMFDGTGKVGIGTDSPSEKLEVISSGSEGLGIRNVNEPQTGWGLKIRQRDDLQGRIEMAGQDLQINSGYDKKLILGHSEYDNSNSLGKGIVVIPWGKVGIGTDSPGEKLEIISNGSDGLGIRNVNEPQTGWGLKIMQRDDLQGRIEMAGQDLQINSGYDKKLILGHPMYDDASTAGKGKVVIPWGKVGIGTEDTSNGNYKLYVKDGIRTEKVKVDVSSNWADFVFEEDYKLRSLQEVETFVKENKHLPEIPSATEVEEEGIDLGAMDAKLLQKIEELTLYMIEQDKKVNTLIKKVEQLERENQELKSKK